MLCPNCGRELPAHTAICPDCGQVIETGDIEDSAVSPAESAVPISSAEKEPEEPAAAAESGAPEPVPEADPEPVPEAESETAPAESEDAQAEEPEAGPEESEGAQADESEDAQEDDAETAPAESEEGPEEDALSEASEDSESQEISEPEKKPDAASAETKAENKRSTLIGILIAIICLLVILVVCLTVAVTTVAGSGETAGGFLSSIVSNLQTKEVDSGAVAVTVTGADGSTVAEITNAELNYYYWGEYYYYVQNYGYYFDPTVALDQQAYSDDMTWDDYFLACACSSIQQIQALKQAAEAEGYVMPDDYQEQYDSTIDSMADYALSAGFADSNGNGDVLAYIQDSYGTSATEDSFKAYLYDSYYVTAYSDEIYYGPEYTDAEIEAYYDENSDLFLSYGIEKSDIPDVNVRHILISPEDVEVDEDADSTEQTAAEDAAKADALTKAAGILEEWEAGEATEESFAELANNYSEDTGSNTTGGLYEDVYPGEMVTEFNDWCFDESRQPGDTDIVESSYGYHIMYFVGFTDTYYWKEVTENELRYYDYSDALNALVENYTITTSDKLGVTEPDAVTAMASAVG